MNIIRFLRDKDYRRWVKDALRWRLRGFPVPTVLEIPRLTDEQLSVIRQAAIAHGYKPVATISKDE